MSTVTSRDGTTIAYSRVGEGPSVVLVDGAMCHRTFGPAEPLAKLLAPHFTVYTYDRRGRGESTDVAPYAVEREVEDLAALIDAAGGTAYVYGISTGAALALEAANHGLPIKKLALYEAPFLIDDSYPPQPEDFVSRLETMLAEGRRGEVIKTFMKRVGTPGFAILLMRLTPMWPKLKKVAHTLLYDFAVLGENTKGKPYPEGRWASATVPTLVMDGGKSPAYMRTSMRTLAQVLPEARYDTVAGQNHLLKAEAIAPVLVDYFTDR
jgi:pimeloyl-ACP methyl ester carboxylesterase